jgi:hypothetical protein
VIPAKKQNVDAITTGIIAAFSFLYKADAINRQICRNKNGEAKTVPHIKAILKMKKATSAGAVKIN